VVSPTRQLILTFLAAYAPALFAGEWYLSYRLHSRNFIIQSERLQLSKAMVPFRKKGEQICTFLTEAEDFRTFAKTHTQPLLECLFAHGVLIRSRDEITDLVHHDDTLVLVLPPAALQVDFNDGLVIIKKITDR